MHRTNPQSLRSCPCFQVFRLNFAFDFFDLLLVKFHQTEIIVVNIGATRGGGAMGAEAPPLSLMNDSG